MKKQCCAIQSLAPAVWLERQQMDTKKGTGEFFTRELNMLIISSWCFNLLKYKGNSAVTKWEIENIKGLINL